MVEQVEELGCVRNGYRERKLVTSVGTLTLKIPKLREGTYFPDDIVSKWSRCDTALASCICDMWTLGISNRKVEKALSELGVEKISRSRVSRLVKSLDEEVDDLRHGSLSFDRWPYLWLDATYIPIRETGHTAKRAVVITEAIHDAHAGLVFKLCALTLSRKESVKVKLISIRIKRNILNILEHLISKHNHTRKRCIRIRILRRFPFILCRLFIRISPVENLFLYKFA